MSLSINICLLWLLLVAFGCHWLPLIIVLCSLLSPFRNIGKLARTIKSRNHPELNLVNRYRLSASVKYCKLVEEDDEDEPEEADQSLLLLNPSMVDQHTIVWPPQFTRNNCRVLYKKRISHIVERVFTPLLGATVVARNVGKPNAFRCTGTINNTSVRIGPWKFVASDFQAGEFKPGVCHSYFSIRAENIPHEREWFAREGGPITGRVCGRKKDKYKQDELYYGQFHRFVHLSIPGWNDKVHQLGRCTLWRACTKQRGTGLPVINRDQPVMYLDAKQKPRKMEWIPLVHVETIVAFGPLVEEFARPITNQYVAMQCQI